jgi:endogenous inhibitor of DNA gyrase (YacG/DUF329 family)
MVDLGAWANESFRVEAPTDEGEGPLSSEPLQ